MSDYAVLLAERLGITIKPVIQTLNKIKAADSFVNDTDISLLLTADHPLNAARLHSDPFVQIPHVVLLSKDAPILHSLDNFEKQRLIIFQFSTIIPYLENNYPQLKFTPAPTTEETLLRLNSGEFDATIMNSASADYLQRFYGMDNIKVGLTLKQSYQPVIAIKPEYAPLIPILNKTLTTISLQERRLIFEKAVSESIVHPTPWANIITGIVIASVIILVFITVIIYWNRRLASEVAIRKKAQIDAESANKEKSRFLAKMSHEIRTPMSGVLGMSELLNDMNLTQAQQKCNDVIRVSGESLLIIINDILDYSKIEAGKMALEHVSFNLKKLLDDVLNTFYLSAEKNQLTLSCNISPTLPREIVGDPVRLRQILLNLMSNAFKFTPQGEIIVSIEPADLPDSILFSVQDTGIGIEESQRAHLFKAFNQADVSTTRKFGGTGLGLSISKQLVELMGGHIGIDSVLGQGSTFWFVLPQGSDPQVIEQESIPVAINRSQPLKILVAEDNPVIRQVLEGMLNKCGQQAVFAENGQQAVDMATASNPRFELIFMDCDMPILDGLAASQAIREWEQSQQLPAAKIIALTAHVMEEHQQRCLQCGMDDFMTKPIDLQTLRKTLATVKPRHSH